MADIINIFGPTAHHRPPSQAPLEAAPTHDVTAQALAAGFVLPVAVTAAVWSELAEPAGEAGWLAQVLTAARAAAARATGSRAPFVVELDDHAAHTARGPLLLDIAIGHSDDGDPVVTILLPTEE